MTGQRPAAMTRRMQTRQRSPPLGGCGRWQPPRPRARPRAGPAEAPQEGRPCARHGGRRRKRRQEQPRGVPVQIPFPPHRAHVCCRPLGRRRVRTAGTGGGGCPSACCCRRRRPSHVPFLFFFRSQPTLRSIHFLYPSLVLLFLGVNNDVCSYSSIPPPEPSPRPSSPSSPISSLLCVHVVGQLRLCAKKEQIFVVVLFSHPPQSALSCRAGHCSLCLIVLTRVEAAPTMTDTLRRWGLSLYFH